MRALALAVALLVLNAATCTAQAASGTTFTLHVQSRTSARAAFRQAFASLPGLKSVRLRSALADKHDRFVQGSFTALHGDVPVTGVLLAGRSGVAAGAYDVPARAGQTVPALLARLASSTASAGTAPLRTVSFGTGTIGLPAGWQVTNSYQGCVEAASTSDHGYLAFGCPQAGFAPPVLPGTNPRAVLVLPLADPASMFRAFAQYPQPVGLGVQSVRIAEARAVTPPVAGARSSYVLFDYQIGGKAYRGLALISVAPIDRGSFMFYKSMFMLPRASFPRLAPTMWKSWQSWGVSSGVLTGRLTAAAQSMRETGDIITGAYWDRQHANARTSLGFSQYIRETAQLEDVTTGRRYNGSYFDASTIVQHDPVKYRIVPVGELAP
jgi:hypothetical protein